jgi:hypothetical protein
LCTYANVLAKSFNAARKTIMRDAENNTSMPAIIVKKMNLNKLNL